MHQQLKLERTSSSCARGEDFVHIKSTSSSLRVTLQHSHSIRSQLHAVLLQPYFSSIHPTATMQGYVTSSVVGGRDGYIFNDVFAMKHNGKLDATLFSSLICLTLPT